MNHAESTNWTELRRWRQLGLLIGLVAAVVCVAGAIFQPAEFFRAYLAAYLFFVGIALGSMVILMIYHLTGGAWGFVIRRPLEAATGTLPLVGLLFVPIAGGIRFLYPWAQSDLVAHDQELQAKQFYLNGPFFWERAAIYFALWLAMAWLLMRWSRVQDRTGEPRLSAWLLQLGGFGLVIYGVTLHFAAIDWIMSLEPTFHSSIFGPLTAAGQLLSAQALAVMTITHLARREPLARLASPLVFNDLGNLLLTFLIVWAYMEWFQFMLVWIANLRVDAVWYIARSRGGWQYFVPIAFVFQFVLPFMLLLFRGIKRRPRRLCQVAGLILVMQLAFNYYQVMPEFAATNVSQHWLDLVTPLAIGGVWATCYLWLLERDPIVARHDANERHTFELRLAAEEEHIRREAIAHG